ncbi:MAG: hypothetical protein AB1695_06495 [Stygiobacter sp.]
MKETTLACNMSVLEPSIRSEHIETIKMIFQSIKEIKEISNGFAFLLSGANNILINLTTFIDKERLCCPFFGFIIEIEPRNENIWLKINGPEGAKDFIKAEFGNYVPNEFSW